MKKISFSFYFILYCAFLQAQLTKPTVEVSNTGWGWFNLTLQNTSSIPVNTHWEITDVETQEIVMQTHCKQEAYSECVSFCENSFTADQSDVLTKEILGCKPNNSYSVRARYNNGSEWSDWSNSTPVNTMPMPELTGTDTIKIILWGHSFVRFGDQCNMISSIRLGENLWNYDDNFANILQTELIRLTNKKIKVINEGVSGSRQSDWMNDHSYKYSEGEIYANTDEYSIAVFFFGANDAVNNYPVSDYGEDLQTIVEFCTSKNIKTIVSSIHHTISNMMAPENIQLEYLNEWQNQMNILSTNPKFWPGLNLHELFLSNTDKYLWVDDIHPDLSEGIISVVHALAPICIAAINNSSVDVKENSLQHADISVANFEHQLTLTNNSENSVSIELFDILGNKIISDLSISHSIKTIQLQNISKGIYFCVMKDNTSKVFKTQKIIIR